jgi:hypothetical protein
VGKKPKKKADRRKPQGSSFSFLFYFYLGKDQCNHAKCKLLQIGEEIFIPFKVGQV